MGTRQNTQSFSFLQTQIYVTFIKCSAEQVIKAEHKIVIHKIMTLDTVCDAGLKYFSIFRFFLLHCQNMN